MGTTIFYDPSSGSYYPLYDIDKVEICNVLPSMRFMRYSELTSPEKSILDSLRKDCLPHPRSQEHISKRPLFAEYIGPAHHDSPVPIELKIGRIVNHKKKLAVEGDLFISYHAREDPRVQPDLIGFEIGRPIQTNFCIGNVCDLGNVGDIIYGTFLTQERYDTLIETLKNISPQRSIPHPNTKEFKRKELAYQNFISQYHSLGLQEIDGGMFATSITNERSTTSLPTLVAVHPFYMHYHNTFGERKRLSLEERTALMQKYDSLFQTHQGPLVIVEEQDQIPQTLARINPLRNNTYYVPTQNTFSSLFPFTEDTEFMNLLTKLGTENLKFVGGHDCGKIPYTSFDPLNFRTNQYSGCLRGLANRIEKKGFPSIETIKEYVYS